MASLDPIKLLRFVGGITGIIVLVLGILTLISSGLNPKTIINGIYQIIFGILIIVCELRAQAILKYFVFLTHFLGLGMFYVFVGGLALGGSWYQYAVAAALLSVGIIYLILGCCNRRMGHESFDDVAASNKPKQSTATKPEADVTSGRKYEAAENVAASAIVNNYSSGGAYGSRSSNAPEPAAITQMKQMAAKKAVEHVVDNNNPFE